MALININQPQPQPRAWRVLLGLVMGSAFTTIELLAALALDGWISIALWAIVVMNTITLSLSLVGLAIIAERHLRQNAEAGR